MSVRGAYCIRSTELSGNLQVALSAHKKSYPGFRRFRLQLPTFDPTEYRTFDQIADSEPESKTNDPEHPKRYGYSWAQLLHRVFFLDAFLCHHCGSQMKVLSLRRIPGWWGEFLVTSA